MSHLRTPRRTPSERRRRRRRRSLLLLLLAALALPTPVAAAAKSFYQTLGVPPTAAPAQIKKAYRSLALRHHPDKVPPPQRREAEHRFKEIRKAYEWLSDPKKREAYDRYGEEGTPDPGGFGGGTRRGGGGGTGGRTFSFFDSGGGFSDAFGSLGGASSEFGRGDLDEWIRQMMGGVPAGNVPGGEGRRRYGGDAFSSSTSSSSFYPDFGRAPQQRRQRQRHPTERNAQTKEYARPVDCTLQELSVGCTKKLKVSFPLLGEKIYTVRIRPGWKGGTKIKFPAEPRDDAYDGGRYFPPITFVVREKEHPFLKRRGDDLHWECRLTTRQAERGAKLRLPLPDGSVLEVRSKAGTTSGETVRVSGRGMLGKSGKKGDVVIEFLVGD